MRAILSRGALRDPAFIAILLFIASSPASGACLGKISQAAAPGSLSYNPFAVQNALQAILVTIQNPGTQPCSYQLTIPSASYPLQFGGKLSFGIAPAGAAPAPQSTTPLTVLTSQVKPGQTVRVPLALTIFSGQPAASGLLMGNVTFSLYAAGAPPSQRPLDQVQVPLSCAIPAIFEINIAGSGQYTSIDSASSHRAKVQPSCSRCAPRPITAFISGRKTTAIWCEGAITLPAIRQSPMA